MSDMTTSYSDSFSEAAITEWPRLKTSSTSTSPPGNFQLEWRSVHPPMDWLPGHLLYHSKFLPRWQPLGWQAENCILLQTKFNIDGELLWGPCCRAGSPPGTRERRWSRWSSQPGSSSLCRDSTDGAATASSSGHWQLSYMATAKYWQLWEAIKVEKMNE